MTHAGSGNSIQGVVNGNDDVPVGVRCFIGWPTEIKGNVTVQGSLVSFGGTFDKNVTVSGGTFKAENGGTTILGNLTITGSAGDPDDPRGDYAGDGLWGYGNPINILDRSVNARRKPAGHTNDACGSCGPGRRFVL